MVVRPQAGRYRGWLILLCLGVAALAAVGAPAQNLTYGELKLGMMKHDVPYFGGFEK